MSKLPFSILPRLAHCVDVATAIDAKKGMIASERDYVSIWLTTLRNSWRLLGGTSDYYGNTNKKGVEENTGTDFAIVIGNEFEFKIALFEAKRTCKKLDSIKKASRAAVIHLGVEPRSEISRFSDEIARQHDFTSKNPGIDIFEAFVSLPSDEQIAKDHILTVKHDTVFKRISPANNPPIQLPNVLWKPKDIEAVLKTEQNFYMSMEEILTGLIECKISLKLQRSGKIGLQSLYDDVQRVLIEAFSKTNETYAVPAQLTNHSNPFGQMSIALFLGDGLGNGTGLN